MLSPRRFSGSIGQVVRRVSGSPLVTGQVVSPRRTVTLIAPRALVIVISIRHPSVAPTPKLLGLSGGVIILSRREHKRRFPGSSILICVRPCTSSASRLVTRLFRCRSGRVSTVGGVRTATVLTKVVISAHGFDLEAKSEAFSTTDCLRSGKTSAILVRGSLGRSLSACLLHDRLLRAVRFIGNGLTVIRKRSRGVCSAIITTRATSAVLSVRTMSTSFIIAGHRSNEIKVDTEDLKRCGIRAVVRGLNKNKRLSGTTARVRGAAIRRIIRELGTIVSPGGVGRKRWWVGIMFLRSIGNGKGGKRIGSVTSNCTGFLVGGHGTRRTGTTAVSTLGNRGGTRRGGRTRRLTTTRRLGTLLRGSRSVVGLSTGVNRSNHLFNSVAAGRITRTLRGRRGIGLSGQGVRLSDPVQTLNFAGVPMGVRPRIATVLAIRIARKWWFSECGQGAKVAVSIFLLI